MKKGFTLAEVLLTLGIIGIVAAITLPSLNTNINDKVAVASLKKAFNTLQTASDMVMADNVGSSDFLSACGKTRADYINNGLIPLQCLASKIRGNLQNLSESADIPISNDTKNIGKNALVLTTKDGLQIKRFTCWSYYTNNSKTHTWVDIPAGALEMEVFLVDINGFKNAPNTLGKDMFLLTLNLSNGEFYPYGSKDYYGLASTAGIEKEDLAAANPEAGSGVDPDYTGLPTWEKGNCDSTSIKNPRTCAGSIFDNGKVIYAIK